MKGFSQIILLGIVAVLIFAGAGGFLVLREKKMPSAEKTIQQEVSSQKIKKGAQLSETRSQNTEATGLGNLCSGQKECTSFCLNNRGRCENYCKGNKILFLLLSTKIFLGSNPFANYRSDNA